jgi:hypothetical protein
VNAVDSILQLSGPFMSAKAERRYRGHLEGLGEKKRDELLSDLKKDAARPPRSAEAGWRPAARQNFNQQPSTLERNHAGVSQRSHH